MTIYPAIDMLGGKCVRLCQGDYNESTIYHDSPAHAAKEWEDKGAEWIHLVDLDGAKAKKPVNLEAIKAVREAVKCKLELGGGIRCEEDIRLLLDMGIDRVILGTAAVTNPFFMYQMAQKYGDKIAVGLDAKDNKVATNGWLETDTQDVFEYAEFMEKIGVRTIIFTDIATDGMLSGPNLEAMDKMRKTCKTMNVIASGGVSCLDDIVQLKNVGVDGVIAGKALYTNNLSLEDAINVG
ncbi:MAG: 1-(5-phosphoribosyl)-5-[(5-phosphoribosylamino)methylideneamino]imidazole-4-carboxamide isomerase [Eubacteriales bacterium]|nr:1-(5-phosphoribosyl)-5-[(5-phosphoribosylamino)methylideneamino]imidazole-4-carboxamide isomerase [Eubacteriales bacterium]